jgi:heme/copper-type cytochrome/quinol oxidase subunit 4
MKYSRIPNNNIYDIFITLIIAIVIVVGIYALIPNNNYRLYLI